MQRYNPDTPSCMLWILLYLQAWQTSYYVSAGECIGEGSRFIHCKKLRSRLRMVATFSLSLVYKFCVLRGHIGPTLTLQRSRDKHYQLQHHTTLQFSQLHNEKRWTWIECNKSCFFSFFLHLLLRCRLISSVEFHCMMDYQFSVVCSIQYPLRNWLVPLPVISFAYLARTLLMELALRSSLLAIPEAKHTPLCSVLEVEQVSSVTTVLIFGR